MDKSGSSPVSLNDTILLGSYLYFYLFPILVCIIIARTLDRPSFRKDPLTNNGISKLQNSNPFELALQIYSRSSPYYVILCSV